MSLVPFVHLDVDLVGACAGVDLPLGDRDLHHLRTVLRLRPGADVHVADGHGRHGPGMLSAGGIRLADEPRQEPPPEPRVIVAQALPKGRRFDEVVRQVTELGADAIVAVAADRCVTRLAPDRVDRSVQRWEAVARAAAEQARRPVRPTVDGLVSVPQLSARAPGRLLVAAPGARPLPEVLGESGFLGGDAGADDVWVAVGPEGGWSPDELATLVAAGARTVGLGPCVLRTEHAAAAAVAVVAASAGRWSA